MTIHQTSLRRRGFLVSGAAVAGGFSLGFSTFGTAHAADNKELDAVTSQHGAGEFKA